MCYIIWKWGNSIIQYARGQFTSLDLWDFYSCCFWELSTYPLILWPVEVSISFILSMRILSKRQSRTNFPTEFPWDFLTFFCVTSHSFTKEAPAERKQCILVWNFDSAAHISRLTKYFFGKRTGMLQLWIKQIHELFLYIYSLHLV